MVGSCLQRTRWWWSRSVCRSADSSATARAAESSELPPRLSTRSPGPSATSITGNLQELEMCRPRPTAFLRTHVTLGDRHSDPLRWCPPPGPGSDTSIPLLFASPSSPQPCSLFKQTWSHFSAEDPPAHPDPGAPSPPSRQLACPRPALSVLSLEVSSLPRPPSGSCAVLCSSDCSSDLTFTSMFATISECLSPWQRQRLYRPISTLESTFTFRMYSDFQEKYKDSAGFL